ncbi:MAG: hypothetical protein WAK44_06980, partial [Trebonia sp.]|uniref:hypothetical protein n=1 Tax=Trebonia sp. TaxID=2767075 RepID=UPI003BB075C5
MTYLNLRLDQAGTGTPDAPPAARTVRDGEAAGGHAPARNYFSIIASTSRAESTRYSSPEY